MRKIILFLLISTYFLNAYVLNHVELDEDCVCSDGDYFASSDTDNFIKKNFINFTITDTCDNNGKQIHVIDDEYATYSNHGTVEYSRTISYCESCTLPDIDAPSPETTWKLVGTSNCTGVLNGVESNLTRNSRTDCCEEVAYYQDITCPTGQEPKQGEDSLYTCEDIPDSNSTCPAGEAMVNGSCIDVSCTDPHPFKYENVNPDSSMNCPSLVGVASGNGGGDTTISSIITLVPFNSDGIYGGDYGDINIYEVCCYQTVGNSGSSSTDSNSTDDNSDSSSGGGSTDDNSDNGGSDGEESTTDVDSNNTSSDGNNTGNGTGDGTGKAVKDFHTDNNANHIKTQEILNNIRTDNNANLSAIKNSIESGTTALGSKIDTTNSVLNDIKSSIDSKNNDDVVGAVNDASTQAHTDAKGNKEVLEEIRDALINEREEGKDQVDSAEDGYGSVITDAENSINGITANFNAISNAWITTPPIFTSTGDCKITYTIFGKNAELNMCWLANIKDYFDIFFALLLSYLNFKMYTKITMFIIRIGV
jgi:hypothetical protein